MLKQIVLLLAVIYVANSSVLNMVEKVGGKAVLDLGKGIVNWKRIRNGKEEFIKFCGPTEKSPRCGQFVTADNKPALPKSNAVVLSNGNLVLDPLQSSDSGTYSSPDLKIEKTKLPNGEMTATAPPQVDLTVTQN
ncbi:unnamed protein product [Nippostrongylus brasiliensis]|uniref:Secreted protein n=1 Tax=Nippostrongylus brasiliensis TaxID=27835 RepID=A0A0N4Y6U6_NIPBR|nr:unnamed protein product [Nippostrongylus brasiliensis]